MVAGRRSVTLLFFLAFAAVLAACSAAAPPPGTAQSDELRQTIESEVSATLEAAGALEIGSVQATPLAPLSGTLSAAGVITDRQPQPTATPDVLTRAIDSAAAGTPLDTLTLFGLDGADWINLAVAILIVIAAYIIGSALSRLAVRWLTPRLEDDRAKEILQRIGRLVRWLIVVFILNFNVMRLQFLSVGLKIMLANLLYVAGLLLTAAILWLAVDLIVAETRFRMASEQRAEELAPAILLAHRGAHVILALVFLTILLAHFGINITALAALLGIGGLAISLAARDTVADAIAGIQILIDRPFRVGDRIEVSAANTWGDVVEVGLRTTRIRTRD
ncbi:MAG: mechanosensitive ion channel family protein, partial [Candidatus Promineifilaceae bacterium]